MEYKDQLKDPRWKALRKSVLIRDEFNCQECGHISEENEVHHTYYDIGAMAWEYPQEHLYTLMVAPLALQVTKKYKASSDLTD